MATCQFLNDVRNYELFIRDLVDNVDVCDNEDITAEEIGAYEDRANAETRHDGAHARDNDTCEVHSIYDTNLGDDLFKASADRLEVKYSLDSMHDPQLVKDSLDSMHDPHLVKDSLDSMHDPQLVKDSLDFMHDPQLVEDSLDSMHDPQLVEDSLDYTRNPQLVKDLLYSMYDPLIVDDFLDTMHDPQSVKDLLDSMYDPIIAASNGVAHIDDQLEHDDMNLADDVDDVEIKLPEEPLFDRGEEIKCLCCVCYLDVYLCLRPCCQLPVCDDCVETYLKTCVEMARIRIPCPNDQCAVMMFSNEILARLPPDLTIKYYRSLVDTNRNPLERTCPRCSEILSVSTEFLAKHRSKKGVLVKCRGCDLDWCFTCHAPWHRGMKCSTFKKGDKTFRHWSKRLKHGQPNAQRCPKCKIWIQRMTGCDHMTCSYCSIEFCYLCGRPFSHYTLIGGHNYRYSILGCPNLLYSGSPIKRRAVRVTLFAGLMGGIVMGVALAPAVTVIALPFIAYKAKQMLSGVLLQRKERLFQLKLRRWNERHINQITPIQRPAYPTEPPSWEVPPPDGEIRRHRSIGSFLHLQQHDSSISCRDDSKRRSESTSELSWFGRNGGAGGSAEFFDRLTVMEWKYISDVLKRRIKKKGISKQDDEGTHADSGRSDMDVGICSDEWTLIEGGNGSQVSTEFVPGWYWRGPVRR